MSWKPRITEDGFSRRDILGYRENEDRGRIDPPDVDDRYRCDKCGGEGHIKGVRCAECDGEGVVDV